MGSAKRHGGDVHSMARELGVPPERITDFSANINPLGPPRGWRVHAARGLDMANRYPDPSASGLVAAVAKRYRLRPETIVCGNGAAELLEAAARVAVKRFFAGRPGRIVIPVPSYVDYGQAFAKAGAEVELRPMSPEDGFAVDPAELAGDSRERTAVVIGWPNNPTGRAVPAGALAAAVDGAPGVLWIIDEAFADFLPGDPAVWAKRGENVVSIRSLTKFYAVPGLRLGFLAASPGFADAVRGELPPWSVNSVAQAVGEFVLSDGAYAELTRDAVARGRRELAAGLSSLGGRIIVYPGEANFLLARIADGLPDAHETAERLLRDHRIAVRIYGGGQGLDRRHFRVAVRDPEANSRLVSALSDVLGIEGRVRAGKRAARAIMVQGVSSDAGKSVLATALCRIFRNDGFSVAPFKAQNMTLNAYVAAGGGEMGLAQAVQARACGIEPDPAMNPVLLAPESDVGSRVVVNGRFVGRMGAAEYFSYRPRAFAAAAGSYDALAGRHDIMVLEGAGSPGEVNLKRHDIVNMAMARHAGAPVLIAGDIDRGGLFASFVGIMEVLEDWERERVLGWIVNRFRGDPSLLGDALEYTALRTGRPVLGVVPYLRDLGLPEEDSLAFRNRPRGAAPRPDAVVFDVIDLPRVGRFSDLDPLRFEPDVAMRFVRDAGELSGEGVVVLPDSRSPAEDLRWLEENGLAGRLRAMRGRTLVVALGSSAGMCGTNFSHGGVSSRGLGLIPADAAISPREAPERIGVTVRPGGEGIGAVECLESAFSPEPEAWLERGGAAKGFRAGNVLATALSGIFEDDLFRRSWLDAVRGRFGLEPLGAVQARYGWDLAIERLAGAVRPSLDMAAIYKAMGL